MLSPSIDREEAPPEEMEDEDVCAHCGRAGLLEMALDDEAAPEEEGEESESDKEAGKAAFIAALKKKGGR